MRPLDMRIEAALATRNEDRRWDLVAAIVTDPPDDVLETSTQLMASPVEGHRALGADMLGQLAQMAPEMRPTAAGMLLASLDREARPRVLASIVTALGHVGDSSAIEPIIPLASHAFAEVRLASAFALSSMGPQPPMHDAVDALIKLSRDNDAEVREWATFGLGTLTRADGPDVRDALLARADDPYPEARAEALFGLALRRDPRTVQPLIRALESPMVGALEVDAAAEVADPRLLPALSALERTGRADHRRLRRAIDRCASKPSHHPEIKATPWKRRLS